MLHDLQISGSASTQSKKRSNKTSGLNRPEICKSSKRVHSRSVKENKPANSVAYYYLAKNSSSPISSSPRAERLLLVWLSC